MTRVLRYRSPHSMYSSVRSVTLRETDAPSTLYVLSTSGSWITRSSGIARWARISQPGSSCAASACGGPRHLAYEFGRKAQRRGLQGGTANSESSAAKQVLRQRLPRCDESPRPDTSPVTRAEDIHPRRGDPVPARGDVDRLELPLQLGRVPFVVIVEQCDHRAPRGIDTQLPASGSTNAKPLANQYDSIISG